MWLAQLARLARLAAVVGLCVMLTGRGPDAPADQAADCDAAVARVSARLLPANVAIQKCELAFQNIHVPAIGVQLANALTADEKHEAAKRIARPLLTTPARSDALYVLAKAAFGESKDDLEDAKERLEEAMNDLEEARRLHSAALRVATSPHDVEHNAKALARDDVLSARILTDRSEHVEALARLDDCIMAVERGHDIYLLHYCHIESARTLIQIGYFSAAELEIEIAAVVTSAAFALGVAGDEWRADVVYQRANLAQERGQHAEAVRQLTEMLRLSQGSSYTSQAFDVELNLAYSLVETGEPEEAWQHLEEAKLYDSDYRQRPEWTWVAAKLAYRLQDPNIASELVEKYFELRDAHGSDLTDKPADLDDRIDVASLGAQIELARHNLGRAEAWARSAFDDAEVVRSKQAVLELRPLVLAKRRLAYELRFTALAEGGQVERAAMAFDAWQGRAVQDALATPRLSASHDRRVVLQQLARLSPWLPVASRAAFAGNPNSDAVLRTMHNIDLLALIVANGKVWRLTASHGAPQLVKLGEADRIKALIDKFRSHPTTEVQRATELGALLVPDAMFRSTHEVLYLLLDRQLAVLPAAALRRDGVTLIERRPITRVLRLPEAACVHASPPGHATVLANPTGGLEEALREGTRVAELLHTSPVTGDAANRAALVAAANDAVLHVAAHTRIGVDGAAIRLADSDVSALEIATLQRAPSLTVLAGCSTATWGVPEANDSPSDDVEIASSLASGFLAAGSQHVVATLRPISDKGGHDVSIRFYQADGVADPARGLAAAQAALVHTDNTDWPYFTVFGLDVCSADAPRDR